MFSPCGGFLLGVEQGSLTVSFCVCAEALMQFLSGLVMLFVGRK